MKRSRNRMLPIMTAVLLLLSAALFLSCSGRKTAFTYLPPSPYPEADAAELKKLADDAWQRREKTAAAEEALNKYEQAYAANPADSAVAVRRAEAYFFVAEYVMAVKNIKPKAREQYFEKGLAAGERALELHPGFRTVNRDTRDEEKALQQVGASWAPAVFWTYANMVRWHEMQNPLRQVGSEQRLEIYRKRLRMLDDEFYYGGVYRMSGELGQSDTQEMPFENAYEKALYIGPNFFSNYRIYAQKYAVPKNKTALADSLLQSIVKGDPKGLPENKYEQEIASNFLKSEQLRAAKEKEEKAKRAFTPRY